MSIRSSMIPCIVQPPLYHRLSFRDFVKRLMPATPLSRGGTRKTISSASLSSSHLETLSPRQKEQISLYVDTLLRWNQRMNLTAVRETGEVMKRHIEDSLAIIPPIQSSYISHCGSSCDHLNLVDVGSGPGLPGLILAIAFPGWKVTLLESMQKRCLFLEHAISITDLSNVQVLHARAENVGKSLDFREVFDVAVARAVAEMRVLAEYCLPLVRVGGLFVAAKGYDPLTLEMSDPSPTTTPTPSTMRGGRYVDIGWQHGHPLPDYPHGSKCIYCKREIKSGGVTRLKEHLAGGYRNVSACTRVPLEVRNIMKEALTKGAIARQQKSQREREVMEELAGFNQGGEEEEEVGEEDLQYRRAVDASLQDRWELDQRRRFESSRPVFEGSMRDSGGSSGASGRGPRSGSRGGVAGLFGRTTSMREPASNPALAVHGEVGGSQKKLKEMLTGKGVRKAVGKFCSKYFIYNQVPANSADSVHFKNMVATIQREGEGVKPPTAKEIMGIYLDEEVIEMKKYIAEMKTAWEQYGVTVMCDGWTGPTRLSIINWMVYCRGTCVFLKSIDASDSIKNADYIYKKMKEVILEVGKQNVVQIVTDNGSAFKKAGKDLQRKYPLYWTPCAAHCIDLILEDIGRRSTVQTVISNARTITKFIYNHTWVLSLMRTFCDREIVRPGATRFATNFIALDSLYKAHTGLINMFNDPKWNSSTYRTTNLGRTVHGIVMTNTFWDRVRHVLMILEPIYKVLRTVDNETYPSMGSMYESIRWMKQAIEDNCPRGYQWVHKIIDDRWEGTLSNPMHLAAYFLNPKYQYERRLGEDANLTRAVMDVYEKLLPRSEGQAEFGNEIIKFRDAQGLFAKPHAIKSRKTMMPCEWWALYGNDTPTLRQLAVRVLAQTVSSSPCERNWSTFSLIHTNKRNRIGYKKLQDLVFCHYNMKLRERQLRASGNDVEDPLDLMTIGHYAYLEQREEREDPLYEWVKPVELDSTDGGPDPLVATEAALQGIDVDEVVRRESTPPLAADPLTRTTMSVSSSSKTDTDDDGSDDGDGGGGPRGIGSSSGRDSSQRPLSPFTGEFSYDHATQDIDHGARSSTPPRETLSYTRRKGKSRTRQADEASLEESIGSLDISDPQQGSSSSLPSQGYGSSYGYGPYGYGHYTEGEPIPHKPHLEVPAALSAWSSPPHDSYPSAPHFQLQELYPPLFQFQPWGYGSSSTGTDEQQSSSFFGIPSNYGYGEPTTQQSNDDEDDFQQPRQSFWR